MNGVKIKAGHVALLLGAAALLSGCQSMREAMGVAKVQPDEFAIVTKAPLVVPPDYNLLPPQPGAADRAAVEPETAARNALFTQQTASGDLGPGYSQSERNLLTTSGATNAPPDIRRTISSDAGYSNRGSEFTDKVLNAPATKTDSQ